MRQLIAGHAVSRVMVGSICNFRIHVPLAHFLRHHLAQQQRASGQQLAVVEILICADVRRAEQLANEQPHHAKGQVGQHKPDHKGRFVGRHCQQRMQ